MFCFFSLPLYAAYFGLRASFSFPKAVEIIQQQEEGAMFFMPCQFFLLQVLLSYKCDALTLFF